jgi:nitric oxide reductase subunit B
MQQYLGNTWFWFGSQGYEYVDLGRFWQIGLCVGLVFWLGLMVRGLRPALARQAENQALLMLFLVASIAIPLFYAAGLMYGQQSHLVIAEYWRWWVVHLWVEGLFEVFTTVVGGVDGNPRDALLHRSLPARGDHWHVSPSVFYRDAGERAGVGRDVQRL